VRAGTSREVLEDRKKMKGESGIGESSGAAFALYGALLKINFERQAIAGSILSINGLSVVSLRP
jgi:hypothetical protein